MFNKLGNIILASSSTRRLELLKNLGLKKIKVINPLVDEKTLIVKGALKKSVRNIAIQKALYVKKNHKNFKDSTIISGDTLVFRTGRVLHKARSKDIVKTYLNYLSKRKHKATEEFVLFQKKERYLVKL